MLRRFLVARETNSRPRKDSTFGDNLAPARSSKALTALRARRSHHYSRIVSEDRALGIPPFGTELQPIDFVRFAEACGGVGFACTRPEEVRPALEAAWRIADRPALVEATIDNDADVSPPDDYLSRA